MAHLNIASILQHFSVVVSIGKTARTEVKTKMMSDKITPYLDKLTTELKKEKNIFQNKYDNFSKIKCMFLAICFIANLRFTENYFERKKMFQSSLKKSR